MWQFICTATIPPMDNVSWLLTLQRDIPSAEWLVHMIWESQVRILSGPSAPCHTSWTCSKLLTLAAVTNSHMLELKLSLRIALYTCTSSPGAMESLFTARRHWRCFICPSRRCNGSCKQAATFFVGSKQ